MIAFIKGIVQSYGSDYVVIDHQGIGWQIAYPHVDKIHLNDEVTIYTYLHYTDQDISLFGFESNNEKELFLRLISVKGLGPKTAMNMLAKDKADTIIEAIETGNVNVLKKMPGIGQKTASQIVLDLKGKLVSVPSASGKKETVTYSVPITEACEGLKNLGYKQSEVDAAADYMSKQPEMKTEEYLKIGLRFLMQRKLRG